MKHYLLLAIALSAFINISAQNKQSTDIDLPFNGRILDKNNHGIKKAKVSLVISGEKTKSDKEGYFAFLHVAGDDTLLLNSKEWQYAIPVDDKKSIKIVVLGGETGVEASEDNELLKIGFAHVRSYNNTKSGNIIQGEDFQKKGYTDIYKIIQMFAPGASIIRRSDGRRGISLRSTPTLNDVGEAIYFLDGARIDNLDFVNVMGIDQIEIIKESNMYGMEGANGVIFIKSRK